MSTRNYIQRTTLLLTVAAFMTHSLPAYAQRVQRSAPTTIAGTVRMYGCVPDPALLVVAANPFTIGDGHTPDPRAVSPLARFEPTSDPHVLSLTIQGLRPHGIYRLGVAYPKEACGRVFWSTESRGLAIAGGDAVALDAHAARTTIEVASADGERWKGGSLLDRADDTNWTRRFRWSTTLPDVTGGELQVSVEPFPVNPCAEPETGIVYRQQVTAPGTGFVEVTASLAEGLVRRTSRIQQELLTLGAPVYVRVVPQFGGNTPCDPVKHGVSGWALMGIDNDGAILPPPPPPPNLTAFGVQSYVPALAPTSPAYGQYAYRVIHEHTLPMAKCNGAFDVLRSVDPIGCALIDNGWDPNAIVPRDYTFTVTPTPPSSGGGFGTNLIFSATTLVTGTLDVGELILEEAHKLYEEIKTEVKKVAVDAIKVFAPGVCEEIASKSNGNASCESLVNAGMTIALASMGMPPSIPNWNQLKADGVDYIAAEIATQIEQETGIPQSLTEDQIKLAVQNAVDLISENKTGIGPKANWVEDYIGFEPGLMTIRLAKNTADPVPPLLYIHQPGSELYKGSLLRVPTRWPDSGTLRIPIVLRPNLSGIPQPACYFSWLKSWCEPANVFGVPVNLDEPTCYNKSQTVGDEAFKPTSCDYSNMPAIYFREAWRQKLEATPCLFLFAKTVTNVFVALGQAPTDWQVAIGAAVPSMVFRHWLQTYPFSSYCLTG